MLAGKERKEKRVADLRKPEAECTVRRARGDLRQTYTADFSITAFGVCVSRDAPVGIVFLAETKWFVRM